MSATAQIVENILAAKIEPSRMIETIDQNMKVLKIIEVKLQPEELGRVTVTLKTMRGLLKVEVAAEKQSTQEDLEQNVQQLAVGLGGIQAAEITFAKASSPMDSAASIFQSLSSSGIQASLQNAADDGSHRGQAGQRNNEGDVSSHLVVPAEHSEAIANPALRHNRADGIYL